MKTKAAEKMKKQMYSKAELKELNDRNWVGKGTLKPSVVILDKKTRQKSKRNKGGFAAELRKKGYDDLS